MDKILALLTPVVPVETLPLDSEFDGNVIEELVEEITEKKPAEGEARLGRPKKVKAAAKSSKVGSTSSKKKTKKAAPKKKSA